MRRPMPETSDVLFTEQIKDYDASHITFTVYCIIFVNLFFAVKDEYNNLFVGKLSRHDRTYNIYGKGSGLQVLIIYSNCIQQFLCFFLKKKC